MCILVVGCGCVAVEVMGAALFFFGGCHWPAIPLKATYVEIVGLRVD